MEPPDADPQELWRANNAKLKGGFTARRLGVYGGTACHHACPSGYPLPRTLRGLRLAHPVWATRAEGALLHKFGSVTLELLLLRTTTHGPPAGAYCVPLLSLGLPQEDPSMGSQEVLVVSPDALENYQEAFRELTVATTRGGCSSVPKTKPVVSSWPWLELPGLRLTKSADTRSMRRGRMSSTRSRVTKLGAAQVRYPACGAERPLPLVAS